MYGEFLKWHISQLVAPVEGLFVASSLGIGGLHDCCEAFLLEFIKEIATTNSTHPYYSAWFLDGSISTYFYEWALDLCSMAMLLSLVINIS